MTAIAGAGKPGAGAEQAPAVAASTSDSIVRFVDVQKTYDGASLVVKDLNLSVRRGEFLTLLGPSGSGKTTTLMMLAGFELPTHGEIYLAGEPIGRLPPHKRGIGIVFQSYALFPHMTADENLAFPLEVRRMPKDEIRSRVQRALRMVGMEAFGSRRPSQLSGGQQQRIAVARALVFEPRIVLMDEPLGALDKNLREQMQYELKQLHANLGVTIVYVTHDQAEAMVLSDRIAVFSNGAIEQLATPAELYERPATPYVAHFIGENNRLHGIVSSVSRDGSCTAKVKEMDSIAATAVSIMSPGDRCYLSVRPERICLGANAAGENHFVGRVAEVVYLGDHLRVRILVGSESLVAKVPNIGVTSVTVGETTPVAWRAEDCQAFPEIAN